MKGKSLALVDETTEGFVFPRAWVKQHGVDEIGKYLGEQFVSGGHDIAISSVLNGKADIGTAKSTIYNNMPKWQPWINSELVVLDQSSTVLSNTLCVSAKLDQLYKDQLKEPPLNMCGNPFGKAALKQLGTKRFIETYREQYQPVFKLAKEAGIDLEEYNFPRS
jgi:ABC-type phosphate/phosphonate transport system substrate-binding protein